MREPRKSKRLKHISLVERIHFFLDHAARTTEAGQRVQAVLLIAEAQGLAIEITDPMDSIHYLNRL